MKQDSIETVLRPTSGDPWGVEVYYRQQYSTLTPALEATQHHRPAQPPSWQILRKMFEDPCTMEGRMGSCTITVPLTKLLSGFCGG